MKNITAIVLLLFSFLYASAQGDSVSADKEQKYSDLISRMIKSDSTLTLRDYAELLVYYLDDDETDGEETVERLVAGEHFEKLVGLINLYDNEVFRRELALDIMYLVSISGADMDDTRVMLDNLSELFTAMEKGEGEITRADIANAYREIFDFFWGCCSAVSRKIS